MARRPWAVDQRKKYMFDSTILYRYKSHIMFGWMKKGERLVMNFAYSLIQIAKLASNCQTID